VDVADAIVAEAERRRFQPPSPSVAREPLTV
jgi:hypothetical protein